MGANVSVSVFPAKGGSLPSPAGLSYANLLTSSEKDVGGTKYKTYDILTRTADGSQGGRHHIIAVAEKGGKLFVAQVMAGDKHWAVNQAIAYKVRDSFAVA